MNSKVKTEACRVLKSTIETYLCPNVNQMYEKEDPAQPVVAWLPISLDKSQTTLFKTHTYHTHYIQLS